MTAEEMFGRIAKIDAEFETATGWGSWMVEAANEREGLVKQLASHEIIVPHKYLARTTTGGRVS